MQSTAQTPESYLADLPEDRREVMMQLRQQVLDNLPAGFEEIMNYGMLGYVVPHSVYADGYHCDPKLPLPFMNLAAQKRFYAVYHMGIYTDDDLMAWFQEEYARQVPTKLDMGKSCIRLKNPKYIPFDLIGELASKMTPADWITRYEAVVKR
ncbi:MAG: DUF1801 domain-containing protein [Pseudomonadota bacterium]